MVYKMLFILSLVVYDSATFDRLDFCGTVLNARGHGQECQDVREVGTHAGGDVVGGLWYCENGMWEELFVDGVLE